MRTRTMGGTEKHHNRLLKCDRCLVLTPHMVSLTPLRCNVCHACWGCGRLPSERCGECPRMTHA